MDVSFCEYVSFLKENVCPAVTEHAYNYLLMSLSCTVFDERYGTDILSLSYYYLWLKGAVPRHSAKLIGNYKMPVKLTET